MKRKLLAVFALSAVLALAACGKTGAESGAAESSVSDNVPAETSVSDNAVTSISANELEEDTFDYSTLPAFAVKDLDGNDLTNDLIAGKEITMINVWGTFCPPCIGEMPDLAKLAESLPENAQLIGLVCDVTWQNPEDADAATAILEKAGAHFTNIIPDENLLAFIGQFQFVPTTIFVDADGHVLGEPVIGADMASCAERLEDLLPGWHYES